MKGFILHFIKEFPNDQRVSIVEKVTPSTKNADVDEKIAILESISNNY